MTQTIHYHNYLKATQHEFSLCSRLGKFKTMTRDEMYHFLCIIMLMPHVKKQRVNDYWATDEVFEVKMFSKLKP